LAALQVTLASKIRQLVPEFALPTLESQSFGSGVLAEPVRIAAVRGDTNYGWIQLPRGCVVEVVRTEREHLLVRYDNSLVRIPQSAARSGAVILRKVQTAGIQQI
jgi:hypothetical protein